MSEDGRMEIEGDAGGDAGDYDVYGESGTSDPDGLDLGISGRNACGDGSDGDDGEDGRMGLEADSGAVSEAVGDADSAGEAAAPAAAIGHSPGGEVVLVGPDKKEKKKRGPRGGKQQRLTGDHRKAFLRARAGDDRR